MSSLFSDSAVILLSGGQDSCACLFGARSHHRRLHALAVDYGQRHSSELVAAEKVAWIAGVPLEIVQIPGALLSTSPLTDSSAVLERYGSFQEMETIIGNRIEKTFVPMRNSLFLMLAANRAVATSSQIIIVGACEADEANYPDCRGAYLEQAQRLINCSLGLSGSDGLVIESPVLHRSKAETVRWQFSQGIDAFAALAFTQTAYDGSYPPAGTDHASVLRARGFEEAGLPDPLLLRAFFEGLSDLPRTANYADAALNQRITDAFQKMR